MLGAIAGDIIGSMSGSVPYREPGTPLIGPESDFTATTILTIATAHALLSKRKPEEIYQKYIGKYPHLLDLTTNNPGVPTAVPWVSPVGWAFAGIGSVMLEAVITVQAAGFGKEQFDEAQALAAALFWAKCGLSKEEIRAGLTGRFGLHLCVRTDSRKQSPLVGALMCFLESNSFEQTVQASVSAGGSDVGNRTSIAGALAEAHDGGLPPRIVGEVGKRLPTGFLEVVHQFYSRHQLSVFADEPLPV